MEQQAQLTVSHVAHSRQRVREKVGDEDQGGATYIAVKMKPDNARRAVQCILAALPEGTELKLGAAQLGTLLVSLGLAEEGAEVRELADAVLPSAAEVVAGGEGVLSAKEAAGLLGISRQSVIAAIGRGALRAKKIGSSFLLDATSVREYQQRRDAGTHGRHRTSLPELVDAPTVPAKHPSAM